MNTREYYQLEERADKASTRWGQSIAEQHAKVNATLESATGYFAEAVTAGTGKIILSASAKISAIENKLITALSGESAARVWKAITNGLSAQALDTDNAGLTDFETKLATLELAGFALYATAEAQALGIRIESNFNLTGQADGSVIVSEFPETEE